MRSLRRAGGPLGYVCVPLRVGMHGNFVGEIAENDAREMPLDCADAYGRSVVMNWIGSLGASARMVSTFCFP